MSLKPAAKIHNTLHTQDTADEDPCLLKCAFSQRIPQQFGFRNGFLKRVFAWKNAPPTARLIFAYGVAAQLALRRGKPDGSERPAA